jgi:3-methyl-2-oxobutanoate hydroxymethyltransferase
MNIVELKKWKSEGRKLSMVTCYDAWSAKILNDSPIDIVLVGDSSAMVMHGHDDTIPATIDMIAAHTAAVRRGAPKKFIVADIPFMQYDLAAVRRLMQAGAHAVKLEGYDGNADFVKRLTESGVPVMGHVGLTPQFLNAFGGFKVQGRSPEKKKKIIADARGLEEAGAFAVVLECVPGDLAAEVTSTLKIPTIGIGAGAACDGQVLVLQDLLGLSTGFRPKFLRQYMNGAEQIAKALSLYHEDVVAGKFPNAQETYE